MSEIVIIAGPQAAGKSSVITSLDRQYRDVTKYFCGKKGALLFPMQESRQIIVHKHMLLGAIWMTKEHEREVVDCDMERMDLILKRNEKELVYVDECNVFTIAHAVAHGIIEVEQYWYEYMLRLDRLKAKVLFLNIPVEISWERRRVHYERRLVYFSKDQHQSIMRRYRDYLDIMRLSLIDVYKRLPFPKSMIDANCSKEQVLAKVNQSLTELSFSEEK